MAKNTFRNPRIRLPRRIKKDSIIRVKVGVAHNSYTGLKFVDGEYFHDKPAYFLKKMEVFYDDELVCHYDMTAATSPSPVIRFELRATKEAPLKVVFTNSENVRKEKVTRVKFA